MKKFLLLSLTIIVVCNLQAQNLENTTWTVDDPLSEFFAYYRFGTDTISVSFDNNIYHNTSTYQISGNNLTITALYDDDCQATDVGSYTYLIQNDTLKFTVVLDQCIQRVTALTTFHIVRYQTGVQSVNVISAIEFYPNPSSSQFTIQFTLKKQGQVTLLVLNNLGQVVTTLINEPLTEGDYKINWNAKGFPAGIYFYNIQIGNQAGTGKMVLTK